MPHFKPVLSRYAVIAASAALFVVGWQPVEAASAQPNDVAGMTLHQLVATRCSSCHGVDGNSPDPRLPKLAGQTAAYLAARLDTFRKGVRRSGVMFSQAAGLSDAQIIGLARFYVGQQVRPDIVASRALAARGEQVFFTPRQNMPPCAACHTRGGRAQTGMTRGSGMMGGGMMGRGMMGGGMMGGAGMTANMGAVPNLGGQHAAYTVSQLDAFANGTRPARVMGPAAAALSEKDREAVATYLSGLQ